MSLLDPTKVNQSCVVSKWEEYNRAAGVSWTSANCLGIGRPSSSSSSCSSLLWPIKLISAKEHFISICPQTLNTAINSCLGHSGKQIGTLTSEWLEEALPARAFGAGRGIYGVRRIKSTLSALSFGVTVWGRSGGAHMGPSDARCRPLALSLRRSSLNMLKYIRTPSNIDSPCSLWQAQAVCFCGPTSPLYLSVITLEVSDPKTKREPVASASSVGCRSVCTPLFQPPPLLHPSTSLWFMKPYNQSVSESVCTEHCY